ncbi:Flp pilus assembly protein TadG [Pararobbsia alpina]|uniref:VWA domain-containing protein n=1 Tax=Pararobbsia alpina TaxID=621374 RepID=UPI0039A6037D
MKLRDVFRTSSVAANDTRAALAPPSWRGLLSGDQGSISVVFVLTATLVVGAFLYMFDTMDGVMSQSRVQMASDLATLSAGADIAHFDVTKAGDLQQWQADGYQFFLANMPATYIGFKVDPSKFSITVSGSPTTGQKIQVSAGGSMTKFGALFWNTATGGSSGGSSGSSGGSGNNTQETTQQLVSAGTTVTRVSGSTLELVMVLDNTGSMADSASSTSSGSKIAGLRAAATTLVNDIFAQSSTSASSYVGLVPFANMVNVSGALPPTGSWMNPSFAYNSKNVGMVASGSIAGWGGCPVEPHDANGHVYPLPYSPTDTMKFTPYYYNVPPAGLTLQKFSNSTDKSKCTNATNATYMSVPVSANVSAGSLSANACGVTPKGQGVPTEAAETTTSSSVFQINQNNNCVASTSNSNHILPTTFLTSNSTTLLNSISQMQPSGSTIIPLGLLWGWRMLSSSWSNDVVNANSGGNAQIQNSGWISSDTSLPKPENTTGLQRVIVVLTDGQNQIGSSGQFINDIYFNGLSGVASRSLSAPTVFRTDGSSLSNGLMDASELHSGNPYGSNGSGWADDLNTFQQSVCTAIKNSGITVYSITFGADASSSAAQQNMSNCATPGDYYHAPDSATLNSIFAEIASQIGQLRISK